MQTAAGIRMKKKTSSTKNKMQKFIQYPRMGRTDGCIIFLKENYNNIYGL